MPAMSDLSAHKRPLATAATAAGALIALGFLPSAQASSGVAPDSTAATPHTGSDAGAAPEAPGTKTDVSGDTAQKATESGQMTHARVDSAPESDSHAHLLGIGSLVGAGGILAARAAYARR